MVLPLGNCLTARAKRHEDISVRFAGDVVIDGEPCRGGTLHEKMFCISVYTNTVIAFLHEECVADFAAQ